MISFQKIYGLHGLDHQIIEYLKKEKVITDRQTNRQTDRQTDRQNFLLQTRPLRTVELQKGSSKKYQVDRDYNWDVDNDDDYEKTANDVDEDAWRLTLMPEAGR